MMSDLNPSQREAVCCGTGPCEVIAGPGSGKTLVLTERILYLLDHFKIAPSGILVLTFSRSAAAEMKDRFLKKTGGRDIGVLFGTFHSVFFYILKESTHKNYSLLSDSKRDRLLNHLIARHFPDPYERPSLEEAEKLLRMSASGSEVPLSAFEREYRTYLRENGYVDFDDMITECHRLLISDERIRDYWRRRFKAILVDEFQDINREQYEILRLLTSGRGLFVVGDDDQSIYGFRGSDPSVMQQFLADFPDGRRVFLDINYRCSGCICKTASMLIHENKLRIPKHMTAAGEAGEKAVLRSFAEDSQEFRYLLSEMRKLTEEELDNTAVIVRTNTHAAKIENYLATHGIACRGKISTSSSIRSEIARDLEAYLMLAQEMKRNMLSRQFLYRVMNRPERYLLRENVQEEFVRPLDLLTHGEGVGPNRETAELLRDLKVLHTLKPEGFVRYLYYSVGYAKWALAGIGRRESVQFALQEILEEASRCDSQEELMRVLREPGSDQRASDKRGVRIMTMHVSKGLEFDRVYLPALNEGILPGRRCRTPEDFEEERRLLYVAMTRARHHLELLYTTGTKLNPRPPSRFLSVYGIRSFVSS